MRIDSPLMTNSDATGSFTGSFVGDGSGLTGLTTASYIAFNNVDGLSTFSSSIQERVAGLEDFSSSLDATYATDAQVSTAVSSLNAATSSYALEAKISGSFTSLSASYEQRIRLNEEDIDDLLAATSSYALEAKISGSFTSLSSSYEQRIRLNEEDIDDLLAATGSYALAANISGSFTSLSQSVATDIANIIDGTTTTTIAVTSSYSDALQFNTGSTTEPVEGMLVWNSDDGTLDLGLGTATLQIGQEQYWYVRNNTAQTISNGSPVYASGTLGASGRITVAPFIADNSIPAKYFLGIATEDIAADDDGYVTTFGKVRNVDTSIYSSGSVLYVSPTSAGSLTDTEPTAPNLKLPVAFTVNSNNNGIIAVRTTTGVRLNNAHDVDINSASDGDLLVRSASVWINTKELTGPYNIDGAVTASVFTGIFAGAISQSAQIASDISGSLGPNATLIRSLTATSISGSLGPNATLIRSLTAAGISGSLGTNATLIRSLTAAGISGSLGPNATLIRSLTATGISGSFYAASSSIATDIRSKLNVADTGSFAKTNVNNNFSGEQTFNNITVNGTGSFAYIQSVTGSAKIIGDAFIILNNDTPTERYAGMAVYDSGSAGVTASLQFDGQNNDWFYQYSDDGGATTDHGVVMFGPEYSTIGSPTYPTANTILKGNGSHHVEDTNITDDGSTVKINSNTQITGSLGVSGTITGTLSGNASTATTASHALTALYSGLVGSPPTWNQSTTGNAATATTASFALTAPYSGLKGTVPTWNQNTTGNAATATTASYASAGPFLYVSNDLSDLNDAATARTNLGVDAAGTDNSTNVTLDTSAHNYLSITGQEITLGAIDISDDTNLAAGTGLTLTGDTIAIDSSVLTTADEGTGNGLDADTVDSLEASQFLRSDANDTATGIITFTGSTRFPDTNGTVQSQWGIYGWDTQLQFTKRNTSTDAYISTPLYIDYTTEYVHAGTAFSAPYIRATGTGDASVSSTTHGFQVGSTSSTNIIIDNNEVMARSNGSTSGLHLNADGGEVTIHNNTSAGTFTIGGNTVWHAGNDGAGSGLDADTLDGVQGASYLRSDTSDTFTGTLTLVGTADIKGGSANWNESVQGTGKGSIHIDPQNTTDNYGGAITFGASDASNGDTANAGIYVRSDGNYGTKMYFSTTDSYAQGSKTTMFLGHDNKVGIGTTSPSAKLDVYNSGSTVFSVNGSQGQLFSIEDDLTGTIFTVADISGVPILEVEDTGVVTIDDTLQVYGDITAYYSSDERLKDNITLIENANEKVMQLRGVEFDWNKNSKHEGHDIGVIAQDVEKVLPELVQDRKNGYKGVDYQKIVALLIESNKELIKQNQDLTSRLERLESKLG